MAGHSESIIEFPQDKLVHIQWKIITTNYKGPTDLVLVNQLFLSVVAVCMQSTAAICCSKPKKGKNRIVLNNIKYACP